MRIDLTEEQYKELKEDGVLDIAAPGKGIKLYIEYSKTMDIDYIEAFHNELPKYSRRDYALGQKDLEKLKPKKPYDPSLYHDRPLCPNCGTYMIYNFECCPKCGQKMDWSEFTGER